MLQDITDGMGDDENDTPTDDSGVLTGEQVQELATMRPLIVYEQAEDKKVKVAELEAVRTSHHPTEGTKPPRFSIRIQGVRKGQLTYNAKRTIDKLSLVPVLALIDVELVDRMRVSSEALALGKAAIDSLNPTPAINPLVDLLVTEYEESAPIEREFFLPSEEDGHNDYADTLPIIGDSSDMPSVEEVMTALGTTEPLKGLIDDIDPGFYGEANDPSFMQPITHADPTSDPNFTGTITFGGYIGQQPTMNTQELASLGTVEQVIPEPALIEDGEGVVHVSDNLDATAYQSPEALAVHPDRSPNNDLVDTAVEPMAVPGKGATYSIDPMGLPVIETEPSTSNYPGQYSEPLPTVGVETTAEWQGAAVSLAPGVQEDGSLVAYDPAVHELPIDQLPM